MRNEASRLKWLNHEHRKACPQDLERPACGVRASRGTQGLFGHQRDGAHSTDPQLERLVRRECRRSPAAQQTSSVTSPSAGHLPDVSIGSPVSGYADLMGNSKFCLCPKGASSRFFWGWRLSPLDELGCPLVEGASSYTSRLFEALFAGCIPVILSDHLRLSAAVLAVRKCGPCSPLCIPHSRMV